MKPPLEKNLKVDPRVLDVLGVTYTQLADMDLLEFVHLGLDKGLKFQIRENGPIVGLTISMGEDDREVDHG
jgi:hypothetical protein